MTKGDREFWNEVFRTKPARSVSWFQPIATTAIEALRRHGATRDMSLVDVGGGASPIVLELSRAGWDDLAVLDISPDALAKARADMGPLGTKIEWIVADIAATEFSRRFDIWHDRAVFHFLTEASARDGYRSSLASGLKPGGLLLIATFAPDGPEMCSGLPIRRYSASELAAELGEDFALLETWSELHRTPAGSVQNFTWCVFRKAGSPKASL